MEKDLNRRSCGYLRATAGLFSALLAIVVVALASGPKVPGSTQLATRVFEFTYKAEIPQAPPGTRSLKIWLPYPRSDENQEIIDLQVSGPQGATVYTEPRFGNSVLYLALDGPGSSPVAITLKFKVRRSEYLRKDFGRMKQVAAGPLDPAVEEFLNPDKLVPIDGRIRQ